MMVEWLFGMQAARPQPAIAPSCAIFGDIAAQHRQTLAIRIRICRFSFGSGRGLIFLKSVDKVRPLRVEEARFGWLSLAPALFFFTVFVGFPVAYSLILSFEEWNMTSPVSHWVGLANYEALFDDETFLRSLLQTTVFTVALTAVVVVFSLAMALLIDLKLRFIKLYRTILYLPAVTSLVAIGIVWVWLFDPQYGLINQLLRGIGLEGPLWLADPGVALLALVITATWRNVGYFATIFLAGLQGIDAQYYEAARIDGAGPWACFWRITLPLLRPTVLFVVVMSVILSFQVFALV
jgi:multiple sugar transport system permease protein